MCKTEIVLSVRTRTEEREYLRMRRTAIGRIRRERKR